MAAVAAGGPDDEGPGEEAPLEVPPPTMTPRLASAALVMEAFIVFFATLVASRFVAGDDGPSVGAVFAVGGGLTVLFGLASGVVRRPGGIAFGAGLQVVLVALGFAVPAMFLVGAGFAAMYVWFLRIGRRVDSDRRRWAAELAADGPPTAG